MSFIKIWKSWLCAAFLPMFLGGQSDSDSSTNTTSNTTNQTSYQDKRNVVGDGASAISGNNNSLVMTDGGAVQAAVTLAGNVSTKALDTASVGITSVVDSLKTVAESNKDTFDQALKLIGDNADKTNAAFQTANEEVNGNRVLVLVGMIAVGMIAMKSGVLK